MFTARHVLHSTFCPYSVFMSFVWIWVQTAINSLYSINWLVSITETESVYCAVRSTFYVLPIVYLCFVWIWVQTAIISLYSINWLVSITETECVYCAVRNESLHTTLVNFSISNAKWPMLVKFHALTNLFHSIIFLFRATVAQAATKTSSMTLRRGIKSNWHSALTWFVFPWSWTALL